MKIKRVCVYCASSRKADPIYRETAYELGSILAQESVSIVYGGGRVGSMGAVADGALAAGGKVIGIIPEFMVQLEWAHQDLSELKIVANMRERKHLMLKDVDAVVALPGGSGTLEELMEAITLKRLGVYLEPIILVNTNGFYDKFTAMMQQCVDEQFIDQKHLSMWQVVDKVSEVLEAIETSVKWTRDARKFAAI